VDAFDLQRFVAAQDLEYPAVLSELRAGRKTSHWMWFVFPQVRGLGMSFTSIRYAISGRQEAEAYLTHPVLGLRLLECTRLVNAIDGRPLREIFGSPDDLKFRSSMTLFALCADDPTPFEAALQKYCGGQLDPLTVDRLNS
jgi:uncharacterized protein (DUF1810 family)